jgi:hypothetical protein
LSFPFPSSFINPSKNKSSRLELVELLDLLAGPWKHAEDVEADLYWVLVSVDFVRGFFNISYSLAQWSALANGDLIAILNTESRADVCGEVLVALLVTGVLGDEVEVLAADDEGAVHLGGHDGAGQDTTTDGDEASEGALLVCAENYKPMFVSLLVPVSKENFALSTSPIHSSNLLTPADSTYRCKSPQWRSWAS